MNPGALSHRVSIQSLVTVQDESTGNFVDTWPVFAVVWAEVRPLSAREFIAAAAAQSKVSATIKIRYLAGIKPSMRVVDGADIYQVEGVLNDPKSGREWITLACSQVVSG